MPSSRCVHLDTAGPYTIYSWLNGVAYEILNGSKAVWLQGDDASMFRDEYDELLKDHMTPGTRASRFEWADLVDTMCGCYFE